MKQQKESLPELLTLKEAAALLKCHPNTLRLWDKDGTLPMIRIGKKHAIRYNKQDIQKLLEKQKDQYINYLQETQDRFEKSERELRYQLQIMQGITESTATIIFVAGRDGNITFINPEAQKVFGYNLEELQGKSLHEIIHYKYPDGKPFPITECPLGHVFADGKPVRDYEGVFFPKDGSPVHVICSNMPIFENGKVAGEVLTMQDISERKKLEKSKDEFISIASHELKTPITTMKAFAQILQKRMITKGDKQDEYILKNINKQADRLTGLINDLLNISKIESGKLEFHIRKTAIDKLVQKIVKDLQYTIETHTIIFNSPYTAQAYADSNRIEQVLVNLITNAVKYSPAADRVEVTIQNKKKDIVVSVKDFGMGIAKKDQKKIFERFYRTSDKEKQKKEGFGLGLYISSEIIKRHGGKIWVESQKGEGSIFCFSLPTRKK